MLFLSTNFSKSGILESFVSIFQNLKKYFKKLRKSKKTLGKYSKLLEKTQGKTQCLGGLPPSLDLPSGVKKKSRRGELKSKLLR